MLYQSASQLAVEIQLNDDPYERRGFGFELYPATLVTAGLSLVTLVTPDMDSPFSQSLLHALRQALISRAGG